MLEFIAGRLIALLEHELEKHGPALSEAIIEQIEDLGLFIMQFVKDKMNGDEPKPQQLEHHDDND